MFDNYFMFLLTALYFSLFVLLGFTLIFDSGQWFVVDTNLFSTVVTRSRIFLFNLLHCIKLQHHGSHASRSGDVTSTLVVYLHISRALFLNTNMKIRVQGRLQSTTATS